MSKYGNNKNARYAGLKQTGTHENEPEIMEALVVLRVSVILLGMSARQVGLVMG
jgi:hypothetical protein